MTPIALAPGEVLGGAYRVVRAIGAGAMGAVVEVERDGARFAAKLLRATAKDRDELRARFAREAAVSAALVHENICPVVDHGVDEARELPFLVMPLLVGEDLEQAIRRAGALDPRAVVPLFLQALRGLSAAHAAGVVHRDVKPSNLLLARDADAKVTVKLVDFGLAKAEAAIPIGTLTASNRFMGTPQYVSPEQATSAKRVDARSDLWSLAMTMFHALAGVPAFDKPGTLMAIVVDVGGTKRVRSVQIPAPWIDPKVARVLHGALVRDPELRCPSADEMALALEMAVGFDAARRPVHAGDVVGVPDAVRAAAAPVARLPASWSELLRFA